jgi:hypothetical protein
MIKIIANLTFILMMISCQTVPSVKYTSRAFAKQLDGWVGKDKKALIKSLGYPDSERKSPDGNIVYEYVNRRSIKTSSSATSTTIGNSTFTSISGGDSYDFECKTWYEFTGDKIISTNFRGNDCREPEMLMGCQVNGQFIDKAAKRIDQSGREWPLCSGHPAVYELDALYINFKK